WGHEDIIVTVATDGYELYLSEHEKILARDFANGFGEVDAAEVFAEHLASVDTDHMRELGVEERNRIFNLGYYTWVEQQGVSVDDFDARRDQSFWDGLRPLTDTWDELITEFNGHTGTA
ncbi:MAG: pyridoxal-5'-phosphate-dependent protein subunit beta, partial [Acidimicrobiia bacterium]|nr:pyridoxal-5'-phosphate-dependent protein subunit beta [Acidimicrobiia bacterium]